MHTPEVVFARITELHRSHSLHDFNRIPSRSSLSEPSILNHFLNRRSLRFTNDGRYLACAEPADFVRIYDVWDNFHTCQEIDLFGEVSGISFSPCGDTLFVGIADRVYGSMMQFRRNRRGQGIAFTKPFIPLLISDHVVHPPPAYPSLRLFKNTILHHCKT